MCMRVHFACTRTCLYSVLCTVHVFMGRPYMHMYNVHCILMYSLQQMLMLVYHACTVCVHIGTYKINVLCVQRSRLEHVDVLFNSQQAGRLVYPPPMPPERRGQLYLLLQHLPPVAKPTSRRGSACVDAGRRGCSR